MEWIDYRDRLGIGFSDSEKVEYFMVKVFNILDDISEQMRAVFSNREYFSFCDTTGTPMHHGQLFGEEYSIIVDVLRKKRHSI